MPAATPDYRIEQFDPFHWEGVPPQFVKQHIGTQVRPGTLNAQHTKLGRWGDEFTVRLTRYYATFALAEKARRDVIEPLNDLDDLATVWYAGVNYYTQHKHKYRVTRANVIDVRTVAAWQGTVSSVQISLTAPTKVVVDVSMVAHEL